MRDVCVIDGSRLQRYPLNLMAALSGKMVLRPTLAAGSTQGSLYATYHRIGILSCLVWLVPASGSYLRASSSFACGQCAYCTYAPS